MVYLNILNLMANEKETPEMFLNKLIVLHFRSLPKREHK